MSDPRSVDFGRLITAMVTPFDENGEVSYQKAADLARHLVRNGTTSIVVSGTTGESPNLTTREKLELFAVVGASVGHDAKVIAGTGNYSTRESIELTHTAEETGVDGFLLVVPYYNNPPQEGLYRHFRAIAESTDLPCIVYNVPSRTVRNMEAGTTIRLAKDVPNIVGIKEASDSLDQVAELVRGLPEDFLIWSGNDNDIFLKMCLGAYGVVSVASHLVGGLISDMIQEVEAGDLEDARNSHLKLFPLAKALFPPVSPVASPSSVKAALSLCGMGVGGLRLPLTELPAEALGRLENLLRYEYYTKGLLDEGLVMARASAP